MFERSPSDVVEVSAPVGSRSFIMKLCVPREVQGSRPQGDSLVMFEVHLASNERSS
jgi:hypothetical protein